jgi:hypothetical protein
MFHHLQPLIHSVSKNQVVAVVTSAILMTLPYVCYGLWNIAAGAPIHSISTWRWYAFFYL